MRGALDVSVKGLDKGRQDGAKLQGNGFSGARTGRNTGLPGQLVLWILSKKSKQEVQGWDTISL